VNLSGPTLDLSAEINHNVGSTNTRAKGLYARSNFERHFARRSERYIRWLRDRDADRGLSDGERQRVDGKSSLGEHRRDRKRPVRSCRGGSVHLISYDRRGAAIGPTDRGNGWSDSIAPHQGSLAAGLAVAGLGGFLIGDNGDAKPLAIPIRYPSYLVAERCRPSGIRPSDLHRAMMALTTSM
jgi:hypothetical protein